MLDPRIWGASGELQVLSSRRFDQHLAAQQVFDG